MMSLLGVESDWKRHWKGMPEFGQKDLTAFQTLTVHFRCPADRDDFARLIGRRLTPRTQSIWHPREDIGTFANKHFVSAKQVNPCHPVYVISKGRWDRSLTARALGRMGIPFSLVVEPQEHEQYTSVAEKTGAQLLTLPFSNLGKGSIPARNWVWEHSIAAGAERHWILDDNIQGFYRLYRNLKTPVACGSTFLAAEEFVDRYENVGLAGLNYFMFASRKTVVPPYVLNTRIYSCILIRNDLEFRWRGRYNEDTDLSLRVLKAGFCTVLFNAFLAKKQATMTMKGGNTDELYKGDGRLRMANSLAKQHPDCVKITTKWGRPQHQVDYSRFRRNRLKLKAVVHKPQNVNNFGMHLELDHDSRLVLIGQAPGSKGNGKPLEGRIGKLLAELTGLTVEDYLRLTERYNLLSRWPGKNGKGDAWPADEAAEKAENMTTELTGRRVLLLGRNVARAFGLGDLPLMTWQEWNEGKVALIPHPSGIVRWWNDKKNKKEAGDFFRDAVEDLGNW